MIIQTEIGLGSANGKWQEKKMSKKDKAIHKIMHVAVTRHYPTICCARSHNYVLEKDRTRIA
jgi:hypothetical protein